MQWYGLTQRRPSPQAWPCLCVARSEGSGEGVTATAQAGVEARVRIVACKGVTSRLHFCKLLLPPPCRRLTRAVLVLRLVPGQVVVAERLGRAGEGGDAIGNGTVRWQQQQPTLAAAAAVRTHHKGAPPRVVTQDSLRGHGLGWGIERSWRCTRLSNPQRRFATHPSPPLTWNVLSRSTRFLYRPTANHVNTPTVVAVKAGERPGKAAATSLARRFASERDGAAGARMYRRLGCGYPWIAGGGMGEDMSTSTQLQGKWKAWVGVGKRRLALRSRALTLTMAQ